MDLENGSEAWEISLVLLFKIAFKNMFIVPEQLKYHPL